MKNFLIVIGCLLVAMVLISMGGAASSFGGGQEESLKEPSLLVLNLEGPIFNHPEFHFLTFLRKYRGEENIKGIVIRVNSPGGVVGTSQEIYSEIKRVREELQKPVVISVQDIAASGAYYAAIAADRIVTNPGALMGSIGVIMQFANLERLYDWAKVRPFVIKTGKFKDAGSDSRAMTGEEKQLFQDMVNEVWEQFKAAVAKNRKLAPDIVEKYSDGRIFTGESAVKLGFADQVGTFDDAVRIAGELSGLGEEPKLFTPKKKRNEWLEMLTESRAVTSKSQLIQAFEQFLKAKASGVPMYMMPGTFGL